MDEEEKWKICRSYAVDTNEKEKNKSIHPSA